MKEIGSEFWDVPIQDEKNSLFPETTQWYLSGRSALQAIIKELQNCHTVAMPSWCCESMIKPFLNAGIKVLFYPVYWKEGLIQEINTNSDILFLMDYFGHTTNQQDLNCYNGIIIRDITHSILSTIHKDADYYFGSLRKWCGVWTGGYAWATDCHRLPIVETGDNGYTELRKQAMKLKNSYINELGVIDKKYLKLYENAENILEKINIVPADDRDVTIAKKLDINLIKQRRRQNAMVLRSAFKEWLLFPELKNDDCPMFVPVLIPDGRRDELRKYLMLHQIYCPIHWPGSTFHILNENTEYLFNNELSLVCDQRYTEEDMTKIIEIIESYWKKAYQC